MEITVKEFRHVELITITGRVDSVEAARLVHALKAAHDQGRYKLVIDMRQVEYMSSAGFRALGDAQRNSQRHPQGEVILTQVPSHIHEALDLVGFTEYFKIMDPVSAALEYAGNLPDGLSSAEAEPSAPNP
jgi:anti-sigma B factor antagonist